MAGLLDMFEDPNQAAMFKLATGLLSAGGPSARPVSLGQAFGSAGNDAMGAYQQAKEQQFQGLQRQLQMQEFARKQAAQKAQQEALSRLPPEVQQAVMAGVPYADIWKRDNPEAKFETVFTPEGREQKAFVSPKGMVPVGGTKQEQMPWEYEMGPNGLQMKPAVIAAKTQVAQAGKPTTINKIDVKTGESLASQVGPMLKDSRIQTEGAVKMFDAADRIEKAIASNQVSAGPLTTQIQTVKQLVQKVSGGNDDGIRQTRQVIKSLAQMAVEARKQLHGQGQVTESEAAAVAKADSGDINDLTIGELKDLATLTKRASHYQASGHKQMLDELNTTGTQGLAKFYQVPGMEQLLQHKPTLPQIGPAAGVDALVNKYRSK